jgi:hypothetical protein
LRGGHSGDHQPIGAGNASAIEIRSNIGRPAYAQIRWIGRGARKTGLALRAGSGAVVAATAHGETARDRTHVAADAAIRADLLISQRSVESAVLACATVARQAI